MLRLRRGVSPNIQPQLVSLRLFLAPSIVKLSTRFHFTVFMAVVSDTIYTPSIEIIMFTAVTWRKYCLYGDAEWKSFQCN